MRSASGKLVKPTDFIFSFISCTLAAVFWAARDFLEAEVADDDGFLPVDNHETDFIIKQWQCWGAGHFRGGPGLRPGSWLQLSSEPLT